MEIEMKKFLTPVVAGFALLAAGFAFAADATDTIKAIDATARTVTLNDNKVYAFPANVDITKLKVGDKVKVTFTTDAAGKNNATAVAAAA
jgi:Cu/Ag efflux protein CusF